MTINPDNSHTTAKPSYIVNSSLRKRDNDPPLFLEDGRPTLNGYAIMPIECYADLLERLANPSEVEVYNAKQIRGLAHLASKWKGLPNE